MTPAAPVPTLDELAREPSRVRELPPAVAADLLARLASLQPVLVAQALTPAAGNGHADPEGGDRLLDVTEAAGRLGVSPDYLYRHHRRLPFTVRLGSRLRFSARGIDRFIQARSRGAGHGAP